MVDKDKLITLLRDSLADRRLSRDERHDLSSLLGAQPLDADDRAFVRNRVFDVAREVDADVAPEVLLDWAQSVIKAVEAKRPTKTQAEVLFSPGESCLAAIKRLLGSCQKQADICVFTITDDRVSAAILEAASRGVAVRIISDNDKSEDRGSDVDRLADRVPVRVDRSEHHMHHKFAVFDKRVALTGSYNWTRSAALHNRENLLVSDDPRIVSSYQGEFERLWKAFG